MKRIDPPLTNEQLDKIEEKAQGFVEFADTLYDRYLEQLSVQMGVEERRIAAQYQEKVREALVREIDWIPEHEYPN